MKYIILIITLSIGIASCGGNNTKSNVEARGSDKNAKSKTLEAGADLLQSKSPLKKFNAYLDGFHFYNGNIGAEMEAHHYVSQLNEEVYQATIFDGNGEDAKIMVLNILFEPDCNRKITMSQNRQIRMY